LDTPHAVDSLPPLRRARAFLLALAAVVVVGAVLRAPQVTAWSSSYRLSEAFSGEEVENIRLSTGMLHKHSLNPHAFEYPSLFYYLSLAVEAPLSAAGAESWTRDLVAVRCLSLVFGLGTLVLVGLLGRRLGGDAAGILAAALAACDRTLIDVSALAKPNAAQGFFFLLGLLALASFAARPRASRATLAALAFALAAASKWLGVLGLAALPVAALLAGEAKGAAPGWRRLWSGVRGALAARVPGWTVAVPFVVFGVVFLICVPYALLSPREFGFGFAQTFTAQSLHQRPGEWWAPLDFLVGSLGPFGVVLAASGLVWAARRLARWDGSAEDRGTTLLLWWALKYGALVLLVFVKLPSYIDLWIPGLAMLAGGAWAGSRGWLRAPRLSWGAALVTLIVGLLWSGDYAAGRADITRDTRLVAARYLEQHASPGDTVLADFGAYVPDAFRNVRWNWWGSPPRVVYDESATWGRDPVWPEWVGGHRRLVFENVKWQPASSLLAARPRWVLTTDEWERARTMPASASETADPDYDRALRDGSAGYVLRGITAPRGYTTAEASVDERGRQTSLPSGASGPPIHIYERVR
jgi:4-amino-4-deoxy-L-arabinose transferase-like glycosyltransferase